jgi:antitoxin FitA
MQPLTSLGATMSTMTIRNIDEALKARLRVRAAIHGRSIEEEARDILRAALPSEPQSMGDLGQAIRNRLAPLGGVEPPETPRDPADFSR